MPPRPTVVLLTSVDFTAGIPDFLNVKQSADTIESKLERIFRQAFDERLVQLRVLHRAQPDQTARVLQSPENVAVIYVSHAGMQYQGAGGIAASARITDFHFNSITKVFSRIHPNLRYLGLVGCTTEAIQAFLRERSLLPPESSGLEIQGSPGLADAKTAFQAAVQRVAHDVIWRPGIREGFRAPCLPRRGIPIQIVRRFQGTGTADALMVTNSQDRLVGVFPATDSGQMQTITVWLDTTDARRATDLKLTFDTGADVMSSRSVLEMGDIEVSALSLNGRWEPNRYREGELAGQIVGTTHRVYRYHGLVPQSWDGIARDYAPFLCKAIPSIQALVDAGALRGGFRPF